MLEKPFVKGDKIRVRMLFPGKYAREYIAAAHERIVTVACTEAQKPEKEVVVKIVRDKHNVFKAVLAH